MSERKERKDSDITALTNKLNQDASIRAAGEEELTLRVWDAVLDIACEPEREYLSHSLSWDLFEDGGKSVTMLDAMTAAVVAYMRMHDGDMPDEKNLEEMIDLVYPDHPDEMEQYAKLLWKMRDDQDALALFFDGHA